MIAGGITDEIDPLLVRQVERHRGLVSADQRDDDFLAHQPSGVDLRLAPTRGQPPWRDQREHNLAAMRRLLQRFFPALPGNDAALGIEIEEDVLPAILDKPVADLDGLFIVPARMADKYAGHDWQPGATSASEYAEKSTWYNPNRELD